MATVYAVASAKGGVGKTTTTANLAAILSAAGEDTVVVDADLGMANLAGALGVDAAEPTLHDVLAGEADPADAVREGPCGLRVVPGETELDAYAAADPAGLREVIEAFDDADVVVLDCGAGLAHDSALPLALADETLLVSTPERDALIDTDKTADLADRLGGTVAGAALTRVTAENHDEALVEKHLDAPVLGRIPEDPTVGEALRAGEPLATFAPDAPATAAYRSLATELTGVTLEPAPGAEKQAEPTEAELAEGDEGDAAEAEPEAESDETGADEAEPDTTDAEAEAESDETGADEAEPDATEAEAEAESDATEAEAGTGEPPIAEAEPERADPDAPEPGPVDESAETEEADADDGGSEDEDLEGSVPFRDADGDDDGAEATPEDDGDGAGDADGETEEKKGFFSRLFGR